MATENNTEAQRVIRSAVTQLAALEFMDQGTARGLSQMAEAVANLFMVVYYQAETGRATRADFNDAIASMSRVLQQH
ncbi:type I toxin-antitoxin system ptaRNA1 family toxin [Burkholderia pseudomallei]|uniref:Toxin of toxin-antitoxin type 1 system n=1 Tax=Burkholderia ubonensis TaxID=101571 RepID=A0A1R1J805_9BURK|nr:MULTISPECIES: type I toxin-antitoxin system ptaRNA1 family toxin [Burkholderia]MBO7826980.1 type I toxin-antitoxin system ptaRNA1 family toxin [Burkholderia pseudomallei]MBO7863487.1 type I toxin-antitoxin system ptaRNA1 family toxin [Burkholderia pseudomallei]MBO7876031.1 type I toxin-antitoxin system ptaRNA1 family toxin [Burkholderia pseudomallei]OMG71379.1 toxin of toxin-antitoxin type 1 system [Burkholderia ubonensis]QTB79707.1 type I toxin-antitoxin system ptaRNA1 family toxin [Burkho